jgi:hypothetical protein
MLGQRTEKEYRWYVRRWEADRQPGVEKWLERHGSPPYGRGFSPHRPLSHP